MAGGRGAGSGVSGQNGIGNTAADDAARKYRLGSRALTDFVFFSAPSAFQKYYSHPRYPRGVAAPPCLSPAKMQGVIRCDRFDRHRVICMSDHRSMEGMAAVAGDSRKPSADQNNVRQTRQGGEAGGGAGGQINARFSIRTRRSCHTFNTSTPSPNVLLEIRPDLIFEQPDTGSDFKRL